MNDLMNLSKFINRFKVKDLEFIDSSHKRKFRESRLLNKYFEGICSGKINTDLEACEYLYGDCSKKNRFRNVKYRLRKILLNSIFLIDIKELSKSKYVHKKYSSYKLLSAYKILLSCDEREFAMKLAEKLFRVASKIELTDLALFCAKDLKIHYSIFQYHKIKQKYYEDQTVKLTNILEAEIYVDKYYALLARKILKSKSNHDQKDLTVLKANIQAIKLYQQKFQSYYLNVRAYSVIYLFHLFKREYSELIKVCNNALVYFESKEMDLKFAITETKMRLAFAKLSLNQYEESKKILLESLTSKPKIGGLIWYNLNNYLFLSHILLKEYDDSYKVISKCLNHPNFRKLYKNFHEPWLIKEAYVHFLIRLGKINPALTIAKPLRPFRLYRFLNEVPTYSKDKRGLNISILIIQMLFLILDRKRLKVVDRIDALHKYTYRYLRQDGTFRSNCFIKMLSKIPESNYHPVALKRHTEKLYKKLNSVPMEISEQAVEIEIIPYENLWEIVLELLENQRRGRI